MSHRIIATCFILTAAIGTRESAAQTPAFAYAPSLSAAELEEIRAATSKYQDIAVALADGYILPMDMCITSAMEGLPRQLGAMGLHYIRPDLLKITGTEPRVAGAGTHTDFRQPAVLIYEPQEDGSQKLVAIENLVFTKAWKEAGNTEPPSFHGIDYYSMIDNPETEADEAHGFEPHYELHFWLFKENPAGAFEPFNRTVSCAAHKPAHGGH